MCIASLKCNTAAYLQLLSVCTVSLNVGLLRFHYGILTGCIIYSMIIILLKPKLEHARYVKYVLLRARVLSNRETAHTCVFH